MKIKYPENSYGERMVSTQLRARGIADERVLNVMGRLPRHRFVSGKNKSDAYGDYPLPIGANQTISQPYMVALMSEELQLTGREKVLEIGTGSGYQTAVLAELAAEVYTVELISTLMSRAEKLLGELGYKNVRFRTADGSLGWAEHSPFDRILVAAAAATIPPALTAQLADNGVLVIPVGSSAHYQTLMVIRRVAGYLEKRESIGCRFVPLVRTGESD